MEVKRQKADYGIALDGDADRLVMVDARARSTTATSSSTPWSSIARGARKWRAWRAR